jgi:hypothetical protein
MLTKKERLFAIGKALYFGIVPSCIYEPVPHYKDNSEGYPIQTIFNICG